jgi:hypothetical protein
LLEKAPPPGDPDRRRYLVELEPSRELLGKLAGRTKFTWEEPDAALAAARQLLQWPQ